VYLIIGNLNSTTRRLIIRLATILLSLLLVINSKEGDLINIKARIYYDTIREIL